MADNGSANNPDDHPLVFFRKFVDSSLKALLEASGLSHLAPRADEDRRAFINRLCDNYERATNPERTSIQPRTGEDGSDDAGRVYTLPEGSYPGDSLIAWEYDTTSGIYRPTSNFFSSHDSPTHLERVNPAKRWREAFEDLLAAQQGQSPISLAGNLSRFPGHQLSADDWIRRLQRAGLASMYEEQREELCRKNAIKLSFFPREWTVPDEIDAVRMARPCKWHHTPSCRRNTNASENTPHVNEGKMPDRPSESVARQPHANVDQTQRENDDEDYDDADEIDEHPTEHSHYVWLYTGDTDREEAAQANATSESRTVTSDQSQTMDNPKTPAKEGIAARIISQTTRVERFIDADGTVTTRRVFKRQFADGSEENETSTETTTLNSQTKQVQDSKQDEKRNTPSHSQQKKPSWFWSDT